MTDDLARRWEARRGWLFSLIFAVCALPFIWRVSHNVAIPLRFEDALIVLRYARNLAEGLGFVFNPGERVLGVTTPLHTLLSAIYVKLGGEQAPAVQNVAGVFCLVFEAYLAALILRRSHGTLLGALAAVLILTNLNFNYLYFGMETHLFAALTLLATYLYWRRRMALAGIVLGVAFLTRYDAALLALFVGLAAWWQHKKLPLRLTGAFFATVSPWLIFSFFYFGSILPQSLAAKKDFYPVLGYIRYVFEYYLEYFAAVAGVFVSHSGFQNAVAWLFPLVCLAGVLSFLRRAPQVLVLIAFAALQVVTYAVLGPDPAFRWHYYLLNPVLTMLFLAGLYEVGSWIASLLRPPASQSSTSTSQPTPPASKHTSLGAQLAHYLPTVVLSITLIVAVWTLHRRLAHVYRLDAHSQQLFDIGAWLSEHYDDDTSLLQPSIGILGYATRLQFVDHAGLVTPGLYYYDGLSHTPMMEVLRRFQPDLALVPEGADQVLQQAGYRQVTVFEDPATYLLYQRGP